MDKNIYETHLLSERKLPFIFHMDIQKENADKEHSTNWHTSVELLHFQKGEGIVQYGTQTFPVSAGDLFIVNANIPHAIYSDSTVYYHCLIVDEDFCHANDLMTEDIVYRTPVHDETVSGLFEAVANEFHTDHPYKNAGIRSAVLNLMVHLTRHYAEAAPKIPAHVSVKDENIRLAIGYMKSHITRRMTLDEIAAEAGLSKYYFLREFKKMTGETPISFINKTRCEAAKKMLLTGQYSIREVAEQCGFDDLSYFAKNFKKYTGITPSEYIKSKSR